MKDSLGKTQIKEIGFLSGGTTKGWLPPTQTLVVLITEYKIFRYFAKIFHNLFLLIDIDQHQKKNACHVFFSIFLAFHEVLVIFFKQGKHVFSLCGPTTIFFKLCLPLACQFLRETKRKMGNMVLFFTN